MTASNRPSTVEPSPLPAPFVREHMTRARAYDIAIAFGLACQSAGAVVPVQPRPSGNGYDMIVPAEFIEGLPGVGAYLPPKPFVPPPQDDVDLPPFQPEQDRS